MNGRQSIPVEMVFNPQWWHRNYEIHFDLPFYMDKDARIEKDLCWLLSLSVGLPASELPTSPRSAIMLVDPNTLWNRGLHHSDSLPARPDVSQFGSPSRSRPHGLLVA